MLSDAKAADFVGDLFPTWEKERDRLERIDRWARWDHDDPHKPRSATTEYKELIDRSQTPWLSLVVTAVAQALYVEGYRSSSAESGDNAAPWQWWQANGMDSRQIGIHRAALTYGASYVTVLPGTSFTGDPMPAIRGVSPRRMIALYEDPSEDDWPTVALRLDPSQKGDAKGYKVRLYDATHVYRLWMTDSRKIEFESASEHGIGVCPVVRYTNLLDLEGRSPGEVEPLIPIAARIDQTTFDRLVVQRFASWKVRTIAGMARPDDAADAETKRLQLKVEDLLIAEDPDTKFGTLPESSLDGFIKAKEADTRDLAAVSQTPPHHLLGQMVNIGAEALAAAEASLARKNTERKHSFGESHEQMLRLAALVAGDTAAAADVSSQVIWRDTEIRSLAQVADALGKMAQMLQIPPALLYRMMEQFIPGWTRQFSEEAERLQAEMLTPLDDLMAKLTVDAMSDGADAAG